MTTRNNYYKMDASPHLQQFLRGAAPDSATLRLFDRGGVKFDTLSQGERAQLTGRASSQQLGDAKQLHSIGKTAEVKKLFERSNNGRKTLQDSLPPARRVRGVEPTNTAPPDIEQWSEFAMIIIEHSNDDGQFDHKSLRIQSSFLKKVLREIIRDYQGENFETDTIQLCLPVKSLYLFYDDLQLEAKTLGGDETRREDRSHLECLLSWIEDEWKETFSEVKNMTSAGMITYKHLWSIFKPGRLFYTLVHEKPQIFKLVEADYLQSKLLDIDVFNVKGWYVDSDGKTLGRQDFSKSIESFSNAKDITSLKVFPLDRHADRTATITELTKRGNKFQTLLGQNNYSYDGIALKPNKKDGYEYVQSRIIIDGASFNRFNADQRVSVDSTHETFRDCPDDEKPLLCSTTCAGFALNERKWLHFFVDEMDVTEYDEAALRNLVLPEDQKSLIKAMVENHAQEEARFDDFIKGKGRGLITVLHGPPGVGKTLAVESIAEHAKRPVYSLSSGDLGIEPQEVDRNLASILDLVGSWKAILLLDEADVLLEQRALKDVTRNALVSIFLRRLEYFQGIMFLTTNRVETFDEAFQSRIHIALRLNDLDLHSRLAIWKNFLSKSNSIGTSETTDLKPQHYRQLAKRKLNGRQIKNAVRMAQILASNEKKKLKMEHFTTVINLQETFPQDSSTIQISTLAQSCLALVFAYIIGILLRLL